MTQIHVIGMGLDGWPGLARPLQALIEQAALVAGSDRLVQTLPPLTAPVLTLHPLAAGLQQLNAAIQAWPEAQGYAVVLASGDPLFFGLGRLLLQQFPVDWLTFHPHVSAMQLAFSRLKLPWHDAHMVSIHGRSLDDLAQHLKAGHDKLAICTDPVNSPVAIATLLHNLALPLTYQLWVCENLGDPAERIQAYDPAYLRQQPISFASLSLVILIRQAPSQAPIDFAQLPLMGIPDPLFLGFPDRPGLMTKREIRLLILGELALAPQQIIWDVGAGTGSLAIEIARLIPSSTIFAIEKTAIGQRLIQQNCDRFGVSNMQAIGGTAPSILADLPSPDRIFIGGSGGHLAEILDYSWAQLRRPGRMVIALATLEHLNIVTQWCDRQRQQLSDQDWDYRYVQAQISRSTSFAQLTRWTPLNPITLAILTRQ